MKEKDYLKVAAKKKNETVVKCAEFAKVLFSFVNRERVKGKEISIKLLLKNFKEFNKSYKDEMLSEKLKELKKKKDELKNSKNKADEDKYYVARDKYDKKKNNVVGMKGISELKKELEYAEKEVNKVKFVKLCKDLGSSIRKGNQECCEDVSKIFETLARDLQPK